MIKIIPPEQFKKIPWKNGKGETTELAISDKGTIDDFDWRLSMASVVEDGEFSDFTGYLRHLVLISGKGIELRYDNADSDQLDTVLAFATFDGGCKTTGLLKSGPITDFNLISKAGKYRVILNTYIDRQNIKLQPCTLCFIYCLNETASLKSQDHTIDMTINPGHLMQLTLRDIHKLQIDGSHMIVIQLHQQ